MKKLFILSAVLSAATCLNVSAQVTPAGAGDKDLRDTNVKGRSNELERIDREMKKDEGKSKNKKAVTITNEPAEDTLAAKYGEIKTDYEQIQLSQDSIIKTYQGGGKIDYAQISKLSQEISKSAARLNSNLFPAPSTANADAKKTESSTVKKEEKTKKETKKEIEKPKSIRDLIVDLDNAIGSFATSPMFQNLRVVDTAVADKTKLDLDRIIELSAMLNAEAGKLK